MSGTPDDTTGDTYDKDVLLPTAAENAEHPKLRDVFKSLPRKIKLYSEGVRLDGEGDIVGGHNQVFNIEVMSDNRPHESRVLAGKSVTVIGTPYKDYYDNSVVPSTEWQPDLFMRSSHVYFKQDSLYEPDINGKFTDFSEGVQTAEQIKQLNETLSLQECVKHFKEKLVGAEPMIFDGEATEIYGGFTDFRSAALDINLRMQGVASLSEQNQADLSAEAQTREEADLALGVRIDAILSNTDATALNSLAEIVTEFKNDDGGLKAAYEQLANDVRAEFASADTGQTTAITTAYELAIGTQATIDADARTALGVPALVVRVDGLDAAKTEIETRLGFIEDFLTSLGGD